MIKIRSSVANRLLGVLLGVFLVAPLNLRAQESGASVEGQPEKQKIAHIRGWIFPAESKEKVSLEFLPLQTEMRAALAANQSGAVSAAPGYTEVAEGPLQLELKAGDKILAQGRLALQKDRFYTIAVWPEGSQWTLKVFADGPPAAGAAERPLRTFNFAGSRKTLVAVYGSPETEVSANSVIDQKVPAKVCMVTVRVLATDGGPPAQSTVEVDLSSIGSAYVVVGPDYRGRMRPRVIPGGEVRETEAVDSSGSGGQR
jgi:hypothetical protein